MPVEESLDNKHDSRKLQENSGYYLGFNKSWKEIDGNMKRKNGNEKKLKKREKKINTNNIEKY